MPPFFGNGFSWHGSFFWPWFVIPIALWSVCFTGIALWHAAKRGELAWFLFFLVFHTAGILEMLYLVFIVRLFTAEPTGKKLRKKS